MSKTRSTTLLGVLGLVAVLVAGWLLVLSPRMSEASELEAQAEAVAAANVATRNEIAGLQEQEEQLPRARARAAVLSAQFPPDIAQPELYDLLRRAAAAAGLPEQAITDVAPTVPALGSADGSVTLPGAGTGDATAPTEPAADPAASAAAPAPAGASSVAVTTVDLNVSGPRDRLLRFVRELENLDRAYLMGQVEVGGVAGGADGPGSFTLTVSGTMYMLPPLLDPRAAAEAAAEQAEAAQAAAESSASDGVSP